MNKILKITGIVAGTVFTALAFNEFVRDVDRSKAYARTSLASDIVNERSEEASNIVTNFEKIDDIRNKVLERERGEVSIRTADYDCNSGYSEKMNELSSVLYKAIDDRKAELAYSEQIIDFTEKRDAEIRDFKKSINYDSEKRRLEKVASKAADDYESKMDLYKVSKDLYSEESYKKMKKIAKKDRDSAVESANDALDELEDLLTEKLKEVDAVYNDSIDRLNHEVEVSVRDIRKDINEKKSSLRKQRENAIDKFKEDVKSVRTSEESAACVDHMKAKQMRDDILTKESEELKRRYSEMSKSDMYARYLTYKGVKRSTVIFIGMIPVVLVEAVVCKYVLDLLRFAKKIGNA